VIAVRAIFGCLVMMGAGCLCEAVSRAELQRMNHPIGMQTSTASPAIPANDLQIRVHGAAGRPTLIYCPGLHGDWTLVSSFRAAVTNRVRFVEFTYSRSTTDSLDDYAAAIERELRAHNITNGWLLGESFGSQVVWKLVERSQTDSAFRPEGVILAGGFVKHPWKWGVRTMQSVTTRTPAWCLKAGLWVYGRYARFRHRHAPETKASIKEFVRNRQEPADRLALGHRLELIAGNDPRPIAHEMRLPVYALSGLIDPLVPNACVSRWLRRNCPGFRGSRLVWRADHNVLATAPRTAAEQIVEWMRAEPVGADRSHALDSRS
jgi:pimeloyl-ACP methyl ester carboxylesterase